MSSTVFSEEFSLFALHFLLLRILSRVFHPDRYVYITLTFSVFMRYLAPLLAVASFFPVAATAETLPLHLQESSLSHISLTDVLEKPVLPFSSQAVSYHAAPTLHIKRNRSWERRLEKIERPRFDIRFDDRILYMSSIYSPAGFTPDLLFTEASQRSVERLAGNVASELAAEYGGPLEQLFYEVEERIDAWLKRNRLAFDSNDHPGLLPKESSLWVKAALNFSINDPIGIEGEYRSQLGTIAFSCFPDQVDLHYRLLRIDGGALYAGIFKNVKDGSGLVAFARFPLH
jgi:hypothetical protein